MGGEGTLTEKIDTVLRVADVTDDPELDTLMSGLEDLVQALDQRCEQWGWDAVVDSLENAPGIEDGISSDVIDYVVEDVSET